MEEDLYNIVDEIVREYCTCSEKCIGIGNPNITSLVKKVKTNVSNCNELLSRSITLEPETILKSFVTLRLLVKRNSSYYLGLKGFENSRFVWANVQKISDKHIKSAFWMFRKGIVDSIITSLISSGNVRVFSTGSVKLSSDYDITLSGNTNKIFQIMHTFNARINEMFSDNSASLFDTNLYGRGFIQYIPNNFLTTHLCGTRFYYIPYRPDYEASQLVWGLLHCFKSLVEVYLRPDADLIWREITSSKVKNTQSFAEDVIVLFDYLQNQDVGYIDILRHNTFNDLIKSNDIQETNVSKMDYISLSNYYANEAYYTYGAFMDVVVNQQMCNINANNTGSSPTLARDDTYYDGVELDTDIKYHSLLDNLAFYLVHPSEKYLKRINSILKETDTGSAGTGDIDSNYKFLLDTLNTKRKSAIEKIQKVIVDYVSRVEYTRVPMLLFADNKYVFKKFGPLRRTSL